MKKFWWLSTVAAALVVVSASAVRADTFTYNGFSVNPGFDITLNDPVLGVTNKAVEFGSITLDGAGPNAGQDLLAWCVDIITDLQNSGTYNIVPFTSGSVGGGNPAITAAQANEMASLILNETNPLDNNPGATTLAIWRIEYGASLTFSSVDPIVDADIAFSSTLAADAILGGSLNTPGARLELLDVPPANQVLATAIVPVPEPASFALFGSALLGLAGLVRRRRKNA